MLLRNTTAYTLPAMDSPVIQDDTSSVSDLTEYTEDSVTGSLRPTNRPKPPEVRYRPVADEAL
jgi:hypothetical protein